jgi:ferredoxin-thioredoxin reductase catalytic chain
MRPIAEIEKEIREAAKSENYILNPDREVLDGILEGLAANEEKCGYQGCPCRKLSGNRTADFDIICPCEYRDPDLAEYGRCYCALYVTKDYIGRGLPAGPIPERRPKEKYGKKEQPKIADAQTPAGKESGQIKIWRCRVCGYLCARTEPPSLCPICRAKKEMFEEFNLR